MLNGMLAQIQRALASSEQSAEQARTSEDRMRRFITDASHELRTPLTSIIGALGMLRSNVTGDLPQHSESLITIAYENSTRLVRLINDLLDMEKLAPEIWSLLTVSLS